MKFPLIWIDLCLKLVFKNATAGHNTGCHSVVNSMRCLLQLPLTVSDAVCGIQNPIKQCISHYHLHTVTQFFHPSPYTIIQWVYVWRPGWPIVWTATSHPLPNETIGQEISNFTWKMRRSCHVGNTYDLVYSKFKGTFSKSWGNSSCRKLRYASLVRPTKMKGPNSWSSRTAHHPLTLKCSRKSLSTVVWWFSPAHTWKVVCIINTVTIELRFVSKQDVTMQLATAIEQLAKFQPLRKIARSEMMQLLHVVWIHALCMQYSPHSRVGNTKTSCNSSRTCTWTALYHLNNAFFFFDAFINIKLGCSANTGKCTGI